MPRSPFAGASASSSESAVRLLPHRNGREAVRNIFPRAARAVVFNLDCLRLTAFQQPVCCREQLHLRIKPALMHPIHQVFLCRLRLAIHRLPACPGEAFPGKAAQVERRRLLHGHGQARRLLRRIAGKRRKVPLWEHGGSTLIAQPVQRSRALRPPRGKHVPAAHCRNCQKHCCKAAQLREVSLPLTKTLSHSVGCFQSAGTVPRTDRVPSSSRPAPVEAATAARSKKRSAQWRRPSVKGEQPPRRAPLTVPPSDRQKAADFRPPRPGECNPSGHLCPARADRAADGNAPRHD